MKLSAINGVDISRGNIKNSINYGSAGKLLNKPAKFAYSALFTLSLLSSVANNKDIFVKSNENTEEAKIENTIFKPNDNKVNKAQFIYTDMYGNRWVPYRHYREVEKEAEERKQELKDTEAKYEKIVEQDEQLDNYSLVVEKQYNEAIKALNDVAIKIQSYNMYLENEISTYHSLEKKLLPYMIGGFIGGFILPFGIGRLIKQNRINKKEISPEENLLTNNKE